MAPRWSEIRVLLYKLDTEKQELYRELKEMQDACSHPNLPVRSLGELYMDTCPDCGVWPYFYALSW